MAKFPDFDDKRLIFSALTAGVAATSVFMLLPLYVGVLANSLEFSKSELGVLASMDLVGLALMSITAPFWINRIRWRRIIIIALTWFIFCNCLSIYLSNFWFFGLIRLLSSLSFGVITVIIFNISSYTANPDRFIALLVVFEVAFQVIGFQVVPNVVDRFGVAGFFHFLNLVLFVGLIAGINIPDTGGFMPGKCNKSFRPKLAIKPLIILISYMFFFVAQIAIFSFVERLGIESGFNTQDITSALSFAVVIGLLGAIIGAIVAARLGRFLPLFVSGVGQIGAFFMLAAPLTYPHFFWALLFVQVFWNLPLGQQVGVLIKADPGHRWIIFVPFFQAVGIVSAPAIGGAVLEYGDYDGLINLVVVSNLVYLLLLLPFAYAQDCSIRRRVSLSVKRLSVLLH